MIESAQETSDAYSLDHNDGLYLVPALTGLGALIGISCTRTTLRYFKTNTQVHR